MKDVYEEIIAHLTADEDMILVYLANIDGSTPRKIGSRMIVYRDGSIFGSVGGGKIEKLAIDYALTLLPMKACSSQFFDLSLDEGLACCGGNETIFYQYLSKKDLQLCKEIVEAGDQQKTAWLVTSAIDDHFEQKIEYGAKDFNFSTRNVFIEEESKLIEPIMKVGHVYIFGAGHVSLETVPLLTRLGFHTTVIDDRAEYANEKRFPTADLIVVEDIQQSFSKFTYGDNSYIVIVTRGHMYDREVLDLALQTDAKYIGMIGSKTKIATTFQALKELGRTDIETRVHAPIGTKINAHTPEEIAISIAGELIFVRYNG